MSKDSIMSKKLTFLFIVTFILALVFFSGYFVVRETRGAVTFNSDIDMGTGNIKITSLGNPTAVGDAITALYSSQPNELCFSADAGFCLTSWCDLNDFTWCVPAGSGYDSPPDNDPPVPCFAAKTLILMADNTYKPIEDVKQGDWILTKENEKSDKMVSAKVSNTFEHTANSYLIINNELKVTDIHPIFVNGRWKQAWTIKLGNKLLNEKGEEVVVESLEFKKETIKVYNLEIEGFETYFSGGFYVHNKPLSVPSL